MSEYDVTSERVYSGMMMDRSREILSVCHFFQPNGVLLERKGINIDINWDIYPSHLYCQTLDC